MEPKKYVGSFEYESRRLQDDFLEALPDSREGREANEMWKSLTGGIRPELKDKYFDVVDTHMPIKGLQVLRWWYGQENSGNPNNNVWRYDLGKLVMPIMFKDVDLLLELLSRYDKITHKVKDINMKLFLKIDGDSIRQAFNLHALEETTYSVNMEVFGKDFENAGIEVNKQMIMAFVKEDSGVKLAPATIQNKLADCDDYNANLVNTHIALYQVLRLQNKNKFTHATMSICWGYQKVGEDFILDFPTYLDRCINEGFIALKQGKQIPFRWYSMLMYLILFKCQDYFAQGFDLEIEKDGEKLPVQLWITILSLDWEGAIMSPFENDFAYTLRRKLVP